MSTRSSDESPGTSDRSESVVKTGVHDVPGDTLEWVSHPVKRRPWVSLAVTLFNCMCGALVHATTGSAAFTGLALVILFASLAKFYFPTRYVLDNEGVTVKTTTQTLKKPWSQYRSSYSDKNGLLLSPFAEPSRLENFRGLYLIFANNKDEVTAFVRARVDERENDADATAEGQA